MSVMNQSVCTQPKFSPLFLTAEKRLPRSPSGDAESGSPGGGIMDCLRDAAGPLTAIQVHDGARAPPVCLIVQLSRPGHDPKATPANRSPVRSYSEPISVPFQGRSGP